MKSSLGTRKAVWIWLVNAPGVYLPAIELQPTYLQQTFVNTRLQIWSNLICITVSQYIDKRISRAKGYQSSDSSFSFISSKIVKSELSRQTLKDKQTGVTSNKLGLSCAKLMLRLTS